MKKGAKKKAQTVLDKAVAKAKAMAYKAVK